MKDPKQIQTVAFGLFGAAIGGAVGYFLFIWIARQGFYAVMLPGWLLGVGAGLFARRRSVPMGVACAVLALILGFYTEWSFRPFVADSSLGYFVAHLHQLQPITLIMIALGAFLGYRGGAGRVLR